LEGKENRRIKKETEENRGGRGEERVVGRNEWREEGDVSSMLQTDRRRWLNDYILLDINVNYLAV